MKFTKEFFIAIIIAGILAVLFANVSFAQESLCDYKAEILANGTEFEKENFKWKVRATKVEGLPTNITGTAEIEDSNGKIINIYNIWASDLISKQKTSGEYSSNLNEGQEYRITAKIEVKCNDTNKGNNIDTKIIKIRGQKIENVICLREEQKSQESNIIYQSSDEKAKRLIIIFLLALSILLNVVLIWKR